MFEITIGLIKNYRSLYSIKVVYNGKVLKDRDDVHKDEIQSYMSDTFDNEEIKFIKKSIHLLKGNKMTIKFPKKITK